MIFFFCNKEHFLENLENTLLPTGLISRFYWTVSSPLKLLKVLYIIFILQCSSNTRICIICCWRPAHHSHERPPIQWVRQQPIGECVDVMLPFLAIMFNRRRYFTHFIAFYSTINSYIG